MYLRKETFLCEGSIKRKDRSGLTIFKGIAGKPAPVPTSSILAPWCISAAFKATNESTKCLTTIASSSVMDVRFAVSFQDFSASVKITHCSIWSCEIERSSEQKCWVNSSGRARCSTWNRY